MRLPAGGRRASDIFYSSKFLLVPSLPSPLSPAQPLCEPVMLEMSLSILLVPFDHPLMNVTTVRKAGKNSHKIFKTPVNY